MTGINCFSWTPATKSIPRTVANITAEVPRSGSNKMRETTNVTKKEGLKKANQWDWRSFSHLTE